jgi:Double zinc ribbon
MSMTNYRDLSTSPADVRAGFQFEFYCELTGESWKSPFVPFRRGQLNGLVARVTGIFYQFHGAGRVLGYAADAGAAKAKAAALQDAMEIAARRFHQCERCRKWVSASVYDEDQGICAGCQGRAPGSGRQSFGNGYREEQPAEAEASTAARCPNCQTPSQGGRFCHECGFDMASMFKSCPGCGATLARQARFCTDCGHGF